MKISKSIFRAYDIRGVVGRDLSNESIYLIGLALGEILNQRKVQICGLGRDMRDSSLEFSSIFKSALQERNIIVKDYGEVPTPVLYFGSFFQEGQTGVMITGSHNPPEYNGLKIMIKSLPFWGDDLQLLYKKIESDNFYFKTIKASKDHGNTPIIDSYKNAVLAKQNLSRSLRVGVDAGNGIAGPIACSIYEAMGCQVFSLFCEPDGSFPNHHPDPADPKNLEDLIKLVRSKKLDLGIAFDGDGDRIGVVDSDSNVIWPDRQMMIFSKDVLKDNPGAPIIYDVKCSRNLHKWITDYGGCPIMWKTGHSFMKSKLKETGAFLAGEMSGHIFFNDHWFGFDDAIYAGARLLSILADEENITHLFRDLPDSFCTPEIKLEIKDFSADDLLKRLKNKKLFPRAKNFHFLDGIRIEYEDGFGLARLSNTTPVVVFRFEGDSKVALESIKKDFRNSLMAIMKNISLPF
ncbi:phosphomannomutase/phosphoglucomutase [Betaproteobacteria bacterium]|nr:phosphomannomutase/phosphoglucomutase [Betaproteobacteria bacterium]